jgi:NADPH:quinone reductase-like Zn-dependent oxidoreductase
MRAVYVTRFGGPEVLEVREAPEPVPKPGEVRIRTRAAGLNFAELMGRLGFNPYAPKPPCILGYEVAGVVDATGAGVSHVSPGDRVLALAHFGAHAEVVCAPGAATVRIPDGFAVEVAAALPVTYATAWLVVHRVASVRPGERVLVHMAAGGLGIALLQLLRSVPGAAVFGTASASKHDILRQEGCAHPIDYRTRDYAAEVRAALDGGGLDVVIDPLGGPDWKKGYGLLREGGRLVVAGFANASSGERRSMLHATAQFVRAPRFSPFDLLADNRTVAGFNLARLWNRPEILGEALRAVADLWRDGKITPRVDSTYPFERAADAHRRMHERRNVGKVVLVP